MKRRLLVTGLVALIGLVAALTAMGAGESARLTEAAASGFPSRAYILTLPHGVKLKPGRHSRLRKRHSRRRSHRHACE